MPCIKLRNRSVPQSAKGWLLVDDQNLPRYWATIWSDVLRASMEDTTRGHHLYGIERFYRSVECQLGLGSLDAILYRLDMDAVESTLITYLAGLRNDAAFKGVDNRQAWASVLAFVTETIGHISATSESEFARIQVRLLRIDRLYSQMAPARQKPPAAIRALPAVVVDDLYSLFAPDSTRNPFRTPALRWRNFLIFLLMIHLGLRRGEVAILPADAVKADFDLGTGAERHWLNVDETPYEDEDTRFNTPSLKTAHSRRQLPLTEEIVAVTDIVLGNYRARAPHSYLFNSLHDKPLALRSIHRVFEVASENLSPYAKKALADRNKIGVTAHDLRHTCAVYRLSRYVSLGDDLDLATEKLRTFFGWSPSSSMPRHYARAYFESDSADLWSETHDRLVAALRNVEGEKQ